MAHCFDRLSVQKITLNLKWSADICSIAKDAGRVEGLLYRSGIYLTPDVMVCYCKLYQTKNRVLLPYLGCYCSVFNTRIRQGLKRLHGLVPDFSLCYTYTQNETSLTFLLYIVINMADVRTTYVP